MLISNEMDYDAFERAVKIIRGYAKLKTISPKLQDEFIAWLINETHQDEKDLALYLFFNEILSEPAEPGKDDPETVE